MQRRAAQAEGVTGGRNTRTGVDVALTGVLASSTAARARAELQLLVGVATTSGSSGDGLSRLRLSACVSRIPRMLDLRDAGVRDALGAEDEADPRWQATPNDRLGANWA